MSNLRAATNVAIVVLATLVVAAAGYGGVTSQLRRTAAIAHPGPSPEQSAKTSLPVAASPVAPAVRHPVAVDVDMVDLATAWLLLTDCNSASATSCHYSVSRSVDAGATWSAPVFIGPLFAPTDGDAPTTIRFLDSSNGFVYGHTVAYATHDGGATWTDIDRDGAEVVGIAPFEDTVWMVTRPCAKGVVCPYEVQSSRDGGVTWTPSHQLPDDFAAENLVAFGSGVIVSALPPVAIEMTADQGASWHEIKSPCGADQVRERPSTADGNEIWVLCAGHWASSGAIDDASIFVSADLGKTWSRRVAPGSTPAWIVSPRPKVALVSGGGSVLRTDDGGLTWSAVSQGDGPFSDPRFVTTEVGWMMDPTRQMWFTEDSGASWFAVTSVPSTRP